MDIYVTSQGDTWDSIAYDLFGSEGYMGILMDANLDLLDVLVFSAGTVIQVPSFPTRERGLKLLYSHISVIVWTVVPHAGTWIEIQIQEK